MVLHRFHMASLAVAMIATAPLAHADAIDGDWCHAAQNLNIQGPKIRTPGGLEVTGEYTRHSFVYTIPASEAGAGAQVAMQLLSEETMTLTRTAGTSTIAQEVWKRCKPIS